MLNKQFCFLAGTGRTATHWVQRLIDAACDKGKVATFHDGFPKRAKTSGRRNPARFFENYLLNLMVAKQGAETYIECNPALLEHVALTYGVGNALGVIPAGLLGKPARSVLLTRHPFGYVASLKAREWGWNWWNYPRAAAVFGVGSAFSSKPMVEQAALAWALKTEFALDLLQTEQCMLLKFEALFDHRVTKDTFSKRVQALFDHLGIIPIQGSSLWWRLRDQRSAVKNKDRITLSASEKETVRQVCALVMEQLGYG